MTPDQALACIEQEIKDMYTEGMTAEQCDKVASYVVARAYKKLKAMFDEATEVHGDEEVLRYVTSGNAVPVTRCTVSADLIRQLVAGRSHPPEGTDATPITDAAVFIYDDHGSEAVGANVARDLERAARHQPEANARWIPVTERLPDMIGNYLVVNADGLRTIAWAFFNSLGQWCGYNTYYKGVTHWMPLPDAPTPQSSEGEL